jgi:1-deoxy-D-xylulose-5-phosphate synthase
MSTEELDLPLIHRELGKGEILAQGSEILLIGLGHMNNTALSVRELLKPYGIDATVMDPVFIKPLDSELICQLLLNHSRIVTIEEHSVISGMGAIINNFLMSQGFNNVQVLNCGIPETFLDQGSHADLINEIGLTPEKITQRIVRHFSLQKERQPVKS